MPMSCCMYEPTKTTQSLDNDTHTVVTQAHGGARAQLCIGVQSTFVGGWKPGPSTNARSRTRADANVRPRPAHRQ